MRDREWDRKKRVLLFIPAYNCQQQIIRVLGQLDEDVMRYVTDVIVVNNRSTDGTEEAVLDFRREHPGFPLKLLRNRENYGLGGSHKVAFQYALRNKYDFVIVLHGDDQGNIRDFLPVFRKRLYEGYDCVLGARFMRGSRLQGYSLFRTFGNLVYNFLFAIGLRRRVFDLGSGLNLYCTEMLSDKFFLRFPDDLTFNYCMVMALQYYKQRARFYPVSWRETDQVSNVKMGSQAIRVLKMLGRYLLSPRSLEGEFRQEIRDSYEAEEIDP
ncbi:MAG: glycosyltransferase family 2 protein [Lachnospiraceae bacterium]|nr:glycosyltransferase family 2 protein [Lachnospiraceae bacterium]